jgi:polyisoprenoid-binding protein YceI
VSRRIIGQIALLAMTACGARVERAAVAPAPAQLPPPPAVGTDKVDFDYDVDPSQSRFEVWGTDILSGDHKITFGKWSASIRTNAIKAEVETCTAVIDLPSATGLVRSKLLECEKFPRSTLEATLLPTEKKDVYIVDGITELHGVRKGLRFTGKLQPVDGGYRLRAKFVISRQDFNIYYGPVEPFLKDDVRLVIDVLALPPP